MTREERNECINEVIELEKAMSVLRRTAKPLAIQYIKEMLAKNGGRIECYDEDGEPIGNYICVTYDGGHHPETANPYSFVKAIFEKDGELFAEIDDCDEYPFKNLEYIEIYWLAKYIYDFYDDLKE